jgi:hypothetical protein
VWRSKSGAQSNAQRFSPVGSSMRQMCDGTMLGMPTRDGLRGTGVRSSAFPMPGGSQQGQQGKQGPRIQGTAHRWRHAVLPSRSGGVAVEDSSISVPLESHHLTWEWEGEGEGCGSASFGAVAATGRKQKGRTICSRIKQRAARRDHSPSPTSAQTSPEHHS